MATIVEKTIGTAAGRDYSTISAWEADRDGNLVSKDTIEKGVCYDDSTFTGSVSFKDSTVDSNHYMWLTAADGEWHEGNPNSGVQIFKSSLETYVIYVDDKYTHITKLRLLLTGTGDGVKVYYDGGGCVIDQCIIECTNSGNGDGSAIFGIPVSTSSYPCQYTNNLVLGTWRWGIYARYAGGLVANNTVYGNWQWGIRAKDNSTLLTVQNNIAMHQNFVDDADMAQSSSNTTFSYNITRDNSATSLGSNSYGGVSPTSIFNDPANDDFTLKAYQDLGTSQTAFDYDIAGNPRPLGNGWDIGAYEFGAASAKKYLAMMV